MTVAMQVERVPWPDLMPLVGWRQGEHISLVGPTGRGKSTLALALLPQRDYVIICATKPKDPTLDALRAEGYKRVKHWLRQASPPLYPRLLLWPPFRTPEDLYTQRDVFEAALRQVFATHRWCVYIDELHYFVEELGLAGYLKLLLQQGRSCDISLVASMQRPAHVPLAFYSQTQHLFFWRTSDSRDLTRIGGIGGFDMKYVAQTVNALDYHEFLYLNVRDSFMVRSQAPPPGRG